MVEQLPIQEGAMDVARSMIQGAYYHTDVFYSFPSWGTKKEKELIDVDAVVGFIPFWRKDLT